MTKVLKRKRVEAEIKFWDAQIEKLERERVRVEVSFWTLEIIDCTYAIKNERREN